MDDSLISPTLNGMDEMRASNEMVRFNLHSFVPWMDATTENARNIMKRKCMIGNVVMKLQWFTAGPTAGNWVRFDA